MVKPSLILEDNMPTYNFVAQQTEADSSGQIHAEKVSTTLRGEKFDRAACWFEKPPEIK